MFNLSEKDINLRATAASKEDAILQISATLTKSGYVKDGYIKGMLNREHQSPTFLGNGIAIPHGTIDTRDQVLKTGITIYQFPQGVSWGEEQTAYIVIGIAAKSNEHITLLRQLTHVISDKKTAQAIQKADNATLLRNLIIGKKNIQLLKFDSSMITLNADVKSLNSLQILNLVRLQDEQTISPEFISHVLSTSPHYLGQGVWLSDSYKGNLHSAITLSTPKSLITHQNLPIKILITLSYADEQVEVFLSNLSQLLQRQKMNTLLHNMNADTIISIFQKKEKTSLVSSTELTKKFIIRTMHGLHTRPSTLLVTTIKQFSSVITITNLDCTSIPINGRSLMKVISLGAKQGHCLQIHAKGLDAIEAMCAIKETIQNGLGEEIT
ncbi:Multiphosphoryl transfer protein [Candidatus Hartigia pinicola]|nr:Multiphosphoryl transfer protein [Candidatus Hartigia pinicola]